jgi:hypothetical protein
MATHMLTPCIVAAEASDIAMRAASVLLVVAIAGGRARADEPHHHHHHHHHDAAPATSAAPGVYTFTQGGTTGSLRLLRDRDLMCAVVVPDAAQPTVEGHLSARVDGTGATGRGAWAWGERGGLASVTIDGAHLRGSTHEGTGDDGAAAIPDTPFEATYRAKLRGGPRSVSGLHVLHVDGLACEMAMREHHDDTVTGSGVTRGADGAQGSCGTFTGHRAGDLVMGQWILPTKDGAGTRTLSTLWRYRTASSGWFVNGTWGTSTDAQAACDGGGTVIGGFVP